MEIDITDFFNDAEHDTISGSRMEHGPDAARITWNNVKESTAKYCYLTPTDCAKARSYFQDMGCSDMADATDADLNAMLLQEIAASIREVPGMYPGEWDWEEYERMSERGTVRGSLYRGDDGRVYFYMER